MITGVKTYDQLYWDKEFVEKRIKEQKDYINNIPGIRMYAGSLFCISERNLELYKSAHQVLIRFERQLENIKKLK